MLQADPMSVVEHYWMRRALVEARKGIGTTQPNPMVGAIILDSQGKNVGIGFHEAPGKPHAETIALQKAGLAAKGGTLFVTLEPCCHHGRTPPCTETIIAAGIRKVVAAVLDPNPLVHAKGIERLREAGIDVVTDVCEVEARKMNRAFFHWFEKNRPFVIVKVAVTQDGKMGIVGTRIHISNAILERTTMRLRAQAGAILVGANTVQTDDPLLTVRGKYSHRKPIRAVVDPKKKVPQTAKLFSTPGGPVHLFCEPNPEPKKILKYFSEIGVNSILLEGGRKLISLFAEKRLIDLLYLYVNPEPLNPTLPNPISLFPKGPLKNFEKGSPIELQGGFRLEIQSVIRRGTHLEVQATPDLSQ